MSSMQNIFKRSPFSYIPGFGTNAVLQLIIANGVAFAGLEIIRVVLLVTYGKVDGPNMYATSVLPALALQDVHDYLHHFWTLLTYGWFHNGFWELFSNMLWFYCFGSLVQMLVGHKQLIPLFFYGTLFGGILYLLAQFLPVQAFAGRPLLLGPLAGITAVAAAAVTIAPSYRFFIADRFSVPIVVVAGIFGLLMFLHIFAFPLMLFLFLGGGFAGFGYIRLLQNGYKPGEWMYSLWGRMERTVTPDDNAVWKKHSKKRSEILNKIKDSGHSATQKRVDDILDKINQRGYNSLSKEEKEILMRASKENN